MENEGVETIKNIRDRYDGLKRNPFDEAECGHHYARAMASWAGIIAESGFHYSGVNKSIKFTNKPGKYFWSNGQAWDVCVIKEEKKYYQVDFNVLYGSVQLDQFLLDDQKTKMFENTKLINVGENLGSEYYK